MTAPLANLGRRFLFHHRLLDMVVASFGPDDWAFRPPSGGNSAHWLLGHVTATRRAMLRSVGETLPRAPWEARFAMGSKRGDDAGSPAPAELKAEFEELGGRLAKRLASMTAEEAAKPAPQAAPDGSRDADGALHFYHFHEAYHLGQIGYLRRMRGLPGFL